MVAVVRREPAPDREQDGEDDHAADVVALPEEPRRDHRDHAADDRERAVGGKDPATEHEPDRQRERDERDRGPAWFSVAIRRGREDESHEPPAARGPGRERKRTPSGAVGRGPSPPS